MTMADPKRNIESYYTDEYKKKQKLKVDKLCESSWHWIGMGR